MFRCTEIVCCNPIKRYMSCILLWILRLTLTGKEGLGMRLHSYCVWDKCVRHVRTFIGMYINVSICLQDTSNCIVDCQIGFLLWAIFFHSFRSPLCPYPLLCWTLWRCQWCCECNSELDTEWWRQCWFLPHQHYHQRSPDPIWGASEHHHCQCHTDWFHGRLWVQYYSTWCQLWESGGKWEWAPDNYSAR